jgi:hypothetical protein
MSDTFQNFLTLEHHASVPEMFFITLLPSPSAPRGLAGVELLLAYMATGVEFAWVPRASRDGVTVSQVTARDRRDKQGRLNNSENCYMSACVC